MCLPLAVWSQPHKGLKTISALGKQSLNNTVIRASTKNWIPTKQTRALGKLICQPTPPLASWLQLHPSLVLTTPQRKEWLNDYKKIMTDFEEFKTKSGTFLFYQSIPLEKRNLSPEETRQWLNKMVPLYLQILEFYQTTQHDAALQYALDYVEHAISVVNPYLVSTLRLRTTPRIAPFDAQEFFLYAQPDINLDNSLILLDKKKIVIINDNSSLLDYFEKISRIGILFPGAELYTYGSPAQFLLWFQRTLTKPDIVFTDIQLGDANGYYVAHELRERGYTGGIIALSAYAETEANARQLKAAGFDGMVSLDERYWKMPFVRRVTQAAQVYLKRAPKN